MDFNAIFKPLTKLRDVNRLLEYVKIIPVGISRRYEHIKNLLNSSSDNCASLEETRALVQNIEVLLPRFGDNPEEITETSAEGDCENYLRNGINDIGIVNILPPVKKCCGIMKNSGNKVCTVFRSRHKPVTGMMHDLKCSTCNTVFRCSTYKKDNVELYYNEVVNLEYFMSTSDTVFSVEFLQRIDTDLFRKAASFESISYAYNDEFCGKEWMDSACNTEILDRRRLSDAWYKKTIIEARREYEIDVEIEYVKSDQLENMLELYVDKFWESFSRKWSSDHHIYNCRHEECSKAIVIDGHMKGTRSMCAAVKVRKITSDELGKVEMGCYKMPLKGSMYCNDHKWTDGKDIKIDADKTKENCTENLSGIDDTTDCNTLKSNTNLRKFKTSGICASVYNCGIINGLRELYGCESLTQVYMFLIWLVKVLVNFSKLMAYDDACHLKKFITNPVRADKTEYSKFLASLRLVVDKMHFANHVDKWCRRNVNPYTDDTFKNINTEACEQTFHFISKYKFATKHMSYGRYNIFMLKMCTMYNEDRLVRNRKRIKTGDC